MLRLAHRRDTLQVVDDQIGRPTYAGDLALLIARVVGEANTSLPYGVYHAVGGPVVSWHAFAAKIFDRARALGLLSRIPEVLRIKTHEYPVAATRPLRAVLEPSAELEHLGGWASNWESGLERTLRRILARQHITTSG
jgi:dTDP-4-dehydrorhamnose reductase